MKSLQVVGNLARAEVIVLAEIHNLAHHLPRGGSGGPMRCSWPVPQACRPVGLVPPFPSVERLAGLEPATLGFEGRSRRPPLRSPQATAFVNG